MLQKAKNTLEEQSFRSKIKHYKTKAEEIEKILISNPNEWGKFQVEFNAEIDAVFREIMSFEKEQMLIGDDEKVYKLKQFFIKNIRNVFEKGELTEWILKKPYGYAGDFKIIEDVYENNPRTLGIDRLFDNYVQMSAISVAVRNRKNDFKRMIVDHIKLSRKKTIRIMDLASGPCREILEMFNENNGLFDNVIIDCYDSDPHSLKFAKSRLAEFKNVSFYDENATRIAFRKDINSLISNKYDIIYSTGLFDYFEERIALRLIQNLKKLLNRKGKLMISDVRDKYSNPSVHFMEWVGEWALVYRSDDDFRRLFIDAGFKKNNLKYNFEQQGILQYIIATH